MSDCKMFIFIFATMWTLRKGGDASTAWLDRRQQLCTFFGEDPFPRTGGVWAMTSPPGGVPCYTSREQELDG